MQGVRRHGRRSVAGHAVELIKVLARVAGEKPIREATQEALIRWALGE